MARRISLTPADRLILNSYHSILDGLAEYLGNGFEFVLHSLEDLDHSAVKVVNGHYSGRSVGAPVTDLALKLLDEINKDKGSSRNKIYHNRSAKGSPIRAATLPIYGNNKQIIGLICINFYMDLPLIALLDNWMKKDNESNGISESLAGSSDDLISDSLAEARSLVFSSEGISQQNKNKAAIELLYQKGIFEFKNAVPKVAEMLSISPNTVYLHLRKLKLQGNAEL